MALRDPRRRGPQGGLLQVAPVRRGDPRGLAGGGDPGRGARGRRAAGVYRVRRLTEPTARIVKLESGKGLGLECPDGAPARRLDFSLEEKGGNRTGLYLEADAVHQDAGLRLRCAWSDLLVGLKNVLETGETGFTEPYAEQVGRD